jgi:DNA helicase-2/ATP-dependent DNA helicase PcrA
MSKMNDGISEKIQEEIISLRDELSTEQKKPFDYDGKRGLIIAGAGSGKTRTLTYIILKYLMMGYPSSSIIAFTFTKKAGDELLTRIQLKAKKYNLDISNLYIGTIHGWCHKFLSKQTTHLNRYPLDELQFNSMVTRIYDHLNLDDVYNTKFPDGVTLFSKDIEIFYNENLEFNDIPKKVKPAIVSFIKFLESNKLLTFGSMIRDAIKILRDKGYPSDLKFVFVDEYQDVNPAQVELIKLLVHDDNFLRAVGDPRQCIYQWRGSDVSKIIDIQNDFPETEIFNLSDNYRSQPSIIKCANTIADNMGSIKFKAMKQIKPEIFIHCVDWLNEDNSLEEVPQVSSIIKIINKFIENGTNPSDIAILMRSTRRFGGIISDKLKGIGIPVNAPQLNRSQEFINSFLISLFELLLEMTSDFNPRNQQEEKEIEDKIKILLDDLLRWAPKCEKDKLIPFLNEWCDLLTENKNEAYNVRECLYDFLMKLNISVSDTDYELQTGLGIGTQIIRSIEEVHRRRLSINERKKARSILKEVVISLKRDSFDFGQSMPINPTIEGVTIATIHSAKGLQWPVIVIPYLWERNFPLYDKGHGSSFPELIAGRYRTTINDERRLFYVALTRAEDRVIIVSSNSDKSEKPSRFIDEIKPHIISENLNAKSQEKWKIIGKLKEKIPIRIGLSDVILFLDCPYQYALRRIVGIQPSVGDELGHGQSLHEIIQRRLQDDAPWSKVDIETNADEHVFMPLASLRRENISKKKISEQIYKLQELGILNLNVESEQSIAYCFEVGVVYGIIDGIQKIDDNTYKIFDWKSNIHTNLLPRYIKQLQFYSIALKSKGFKVDSAFLIDVGATVEKGELISKSIDLSDESLDCLMNTFNDVLSDLSASKKAHATPEILICSACDVRKICAYKIDGVS